jgi:hypothetical protein
MKHFDWWIILVIVLIGIFIFYKISYFNSTEIIQIKIKNKESVISGSGESTKHKYLIYCDGEVLENTDSFLFGKFNSSDLYNELEIDSTYTIKVVGWRVPYFSIYRNIIKIL